MWIPQTFFVASPCHCHGCWWCLVFVLLFLLWGKGMRIGFFVLFYFASCLLLLRLLLLLPFAVVVIAFWSLFYPRWIEVRTVCLCLFFSLFVQLLVSILVLYFTVISFLFCFVVFHSLHNISPIFLFLFISFHFVLFSVRFDSYVHKVVCLPYVLVFFSNSFLYYFPPKHTEHANTHTHTLADKRCFCALFSFIIHYDVAGFSYRHSHHHQRCRLSGIYHGIYKNTNTHTHTYTYTYSTWSRQYRWELVCAHNITVIYGVWVLIVPYM